MTAFQIKFDMEAITAAATDAARAAVASGIEKSIMKAITANFGSDYSTAHGRWSDRPSTALISSIVEEKLATLITGDELDRRIALLMEQRVSEILDKMVNELAYTKAKKMAFAEFNRRCDEAFRG